MDLPPSKLGRLPEGLLSFFDIKSMGEYPKRLSDQLQGSIDLTRWYSDVASEEGLFSISPYAAANVAAGGAVISSANWIAGGGVDFSGGGGATTTIVPSNEIWLILEATVRWNFTATAGQSIDVTLQFNGPAGGPAIGIIVTDSPVSGFTSSVAAPATSGQRTCTRPFFALPNQIMRTLHHGAVVPAGQIDLQGYMRIRRLRR